MSRLFSRHQVISAVAIPGMAVYCSLLLSQLVSLSADAQTVLLVTTNNGSLTSEESARQTQFQSWGYTVTTV